VVCHYVNKFLPFCQLIQFPKQAIRNPAKADCGNTCERNSHDYIASHSSIKMGEVREPRGRANAPRYLLQR
jgi:hypothetical protein